MLKKHYIRKGLSLGLAFLMCISIAVPAHAQNTQEGSNNAEVSFTDKQVITANENEFEEADILEPSEGDAQKDVEIPSDSNADEGTIEAVEKDEDTADSQTEEGETIDAAKENEDVVNEPQQNEEKISETSTEKETTTEALDETTAPVTENEDEVEDTADESRKAVSDEGTDSSGEANSFRIEGTVLKKYTGSGGAVTIPNYVTEIDDLAFWKEGSVTSITIPSSVTVIGESAFGGCHSIMEVTFLSGSKLKTIGDRAFWDCTALKKIEIPDSVKEIGSNAFWDDTSLASVQFGNGLETIGAKAFYGCTSLRTIKWNSKVRFIGESAFHGVAISDLTLPDSVTTLGTEVFSNCKSLRTVIIGPGLSEIPPYTFEWCSSLQEVKIIGEPTLIGSGAFSYCSNLINISIPDSVTRLQYQAFAWCTSLKTINIGNGVTDLEGSVFYQCRNLEALYIPFGLSSGGGDVTYGCSKVIAYIYSNATYAIQWAREQGVRYRLVGEFKPSAVTGLKASSYGKNKVRLTWNSVAGAEGYLIYGQKNGKYGYVGMTTTGTAFTDVKALDTDYNYYWVFPYITNSTGKMTPGESPKYVYAKGIIPAVLNLKPSSVTGGVKLTWTERADAEGYLIYGIRGDNGKYGYIGMTTKGTTFTDTKAYKTQYNFYWVFPYHKNSAGKMIVGGTPKYVYGRAK